MLASKQLIGILAPRSECLAGLIPKANLCHKSKLPPRKAARWPYEKWQYTRINSILDPITAGRFNDNTKIIQVEGNVKAGKHDFANRLADQLDMKLMPDINLDDVYINRYGFDYRALNPLLPERLRHCDLEMFHENPARHSVIHMLHYIFKARVYQYIKALQHLLNTGQGVVLVRSVMTDRVFIEAMHKLGWLPRGYLSGDGVRYYDWIHYYNNRRFDVLIRLMKPHLTIYLETPVETCLERIKQSSDPMIANSSALIPEFLEGIETAYEEIMLPRVANVGHVLRYKTPKIMNNEEFLDVMDDIEELDFEYDPKDTRFTDWQIGEQRQLFWWHQRRKYTTVGGTSQILNAAIGPNFDIAGLGDSITQVDLILRSSLYEGHIGHLGYDQFRYDDLTSKSKLHTLFDILHFDQRLKGMLQSDHA